MAMFNLFELIVSSCLVVSHCNPVFILDDKYVTKESSFSMSEAYEGTYPACLQDAYKGHFVHDWGQHKGLSSATFSFDPPQDGCYLVEEYHPGSDEACSRYLPQATKLDIGYCKGLKAQATVDQSQNGGKWNRVGKWPFYMNHKGYFKLSNSKQESCSEPPCFWVADAFRLTLLGRSCANTPDLEEAEDTSNEMAIDVENAQRGSISLVVSSSFGNEDLKLQIQNLGVLESGLKDHFGYSSVRLVTIDIASQRRLASSMSAKRRIDAVFEGIGTPTLPTMNTYIDQDGQTLEKKLQLSFDAKDSGIRVESVSIYWDVPSTEEPAETHENPSLSSIFPLWVQIGLFSLLTTFSCCAFRALWRKASAKTVVEEPVVEWAEKCEDAEKGKQTKEEDDIDMVSVSTAPPSDDAPSETGSTRALEVP